jgi:DNA polymerase-1
MNPPRVIAFDVETHLFGPGNMAPKIVCLSWAERTETKTKCGILVDPDDVEKWLHCHLDETLAGRAHLVGHHVAYDMACILATFPSTWDKVWRAYERDGITCTAIRERLLDIAAGSFRFWSDESGNYKNEYSLEDLARRHLDMELEKDGGWRLRYRELDGMPLAMWPREAVDYAVTDAVATVTLFWHQVTAALDLNYPLPTEYEDVREDFALKLMSNWGVRTDPEHTEKFWNETADRMTDITQELVDAGLVSLETSGKQDDLFEENDNLKQPPKVKQSMRVTRDLVEKTYPGRNPPKTPKGAVKTGKEVIQDCRSPALQKLVEYKGLQKMASTYLSKMFAPTIHARFDAVGAASDRTSSSKPNLQNLPRLPGIRECIVPRPGRVFLACDFDSQEMRTLAQSCLDIVGCSRLAERYQENAMFDPHLEFAAGMLGVNPQDAAEMLARKDERVKETRQHAKVANFGFPGGLGAETFVSFARGWGLKVSRIKSKQLKDAWMAQWPEMYHYFRHASNLVGDAYGTQVIPQSGFRRGNVGYTDCCNGYFQTLAAHASKRSLWEVSRRAYNYPGSYLYGSRPVLFVHDENILETPEEAGHEAAQEIEIIMVEAMHRYTPRVPPAASATLMRRWSKNAERTFEGKRLVPWKEER